MWRFGTRVARSAPFLRHASLAADSDYVVHALGEVWSHHFGALHKSTRLELESLILRMCPGVNIDTSDQMNPTIRAADELSCLHAADVAASAIACIPDVPPHLTSRLSLLAAEEGVVFHYDTDTSSALFVQLQGTANPLLGARLTHLATLPAPPAHLIGEVFETLCGCLLLAAPHNGRTECYALHPAGTTSPPPQEVVMSLIHRNGTQLQSSTSRHTLADALAQTPPEVGSEAAGVPLVSMWHPGGLCVVAATTNLSGWVLEAAQRFTALRGAQLMHSRGKRGLMLLVAPAAQDAAHLNNSREDDLLASAGYLVQRGELSAAEGTDPRDAIPPLQPLPHTLGVGVTPLSPPASLESDISFCLYETVLVMLCGSRVAFVGRHLPCADAADTARLSGDGVAAVPPEAWGQAVPRENGGLEDSGESEEVSMDALFTELQVAGDEAQQRVGDAAQEDHDTKLSALQNDADRIRRRLQRVLPEICALRDTLISYCPDTHGSDTLLQAVSDSVSATTDSAADLEFAVPTLRKALSSLEAVARPAATAPLPPDTTADEWTQHLKRGYSEGVRSNVWSELRESPALRDQCVKDIFFEDGLDMECATLMDLDLVCSAVAAQGMYDKTVKVCICDTSYLLLFDLPEDRHVKTVIPFTSLWELANIVRRGSIAGAAERLASVKKRLTSSAFIGNTVLVAPEEEMLLFAEGEASAHSLLSRAPSTRVPDDRILLAARGVHTRIRGMQRQREAARSVSHDVVQVFSEDRELVSRAAVLGLVTSLPPLSDMAASVRREGEGPHDGLDLCPAVSMGEDVIMSDKVYTGHVRSWCSIKGYGFVWSDEFGDSVFIHASSFGGGDLTVGKTVNFRVKVDEKSADSKNICYDVHGEAVVKDGAGGRDRPSDTRASRREAPRYERADAKRLDSRERRDDRRDPRDDRRYDSRDRRPYDIRDDRRASDYDRRPYDSRDRRDYDRREYDRRDYDRREYDRRDFDRQPERRPSYDTRYHDRR